MWQVGLFVAWAAVARLWAGACWVDMTPKEPTKCTLAGYGGRRRALCTGVLAPLEANAVALRDEHRTVVIVSLDLCWVGRGLRRAIERRLEGTVQPDDLMVACTGTHSGPAGLDSNPLVQRVFGEYRAELVEEIADAAAGAVRGAVRVMAPAELLWFGGAGGPRGFGVKCEGRWRAVVFEAPEPANVLSPENLKLSPDWPGEARAAIRQASGAEAVVVLCSDVYPPNQQRPWRGEEPEQVGRGIGNRVVELLRTARREGAGGLGASLRTVQLPLAQLPPGVERQALPLLRMFAPRTSLVQAIRVGARWILAAPAMITRRLGEQMRDELSQKAGGDVVLAAPANDCIGFGVSEEEYNRGEKAAQLCAYGPKLGQVLTKALIEAIRSAAGPTG